MGFDLVMDHRVTIKESLAAIDVDDDVEGTVLQLELEQIEQELSFFNETYGWNVEYKEIEKKPVVEESNLTDDLLEHIGDHTIDDVPSILTNDNNAVTESGNDVVIANGGDVHGGNEGEGEEEEKKKERTSNEVTEELKTIRDDIA